MQFELKLLIEFLPLLPVSYTHLKKNLDLVVLNSLKDEGAGFNHDTNKITIIDKKGSEYNFGLKSKQEVAKDLVNLIITNITNTTV